MSWERRKGTFERSSATPYFIFPSPSLSRFLVAEYVQMGIVLVHFSLLLTVVSLFLFSSKDMNTVLPITRYGSSVGWRATVIVHRSLVNLPFGSAGLLQENYNDPPRNTGKRFSGRVIRCLLLVRSVLSYTPS